MTTTYLVEIASKFGRYFQEADVGFSRAQCLQWFREGQFENAIRVVELTTGETCGVRDVSQEIAQELYDHYDRTGDFLGMANATRDFCEHMGFLDIRDWQEIEENRAGRDPYAEHRLTSRELI